MKKLENITFTRYEDEEFFIDIHEKPDMYEAWLTRKNYGVSSLMFGVPKVQPVDNSVMTPEEFLDMVERNLEEYEAYYDEEYE